MPANYGRSGSRANATGLSKRGSRPAQPATPAQPAEATTITPTLPSVPAPAGVLSSGAVPPAPVGNPASRAPRAANPNAGGDILRRGFRRSLI